MKQLVVLLFCIQSYIFVNAQITFEKLTGGNVHYYSNEIPFQNKDDDYIIFTTISNSFPNYDDLYMIRLNRFGDTIWTRTYGGYSSDFGVDGQQTSDSGFAFLGNTESSFALSTEHILLLRTDQAGNLSWMKAYGVSGKNCHGSSIQQTSDNGFVMAGYINDTNGCVNCQDILIIRTDSSGDTLWTKTLGGPGANEAYSIEQTNDQGFIISGSTEGFGSNFSQAFLLKLDAGGNFTWSKTFSTTLFHDIGKSVMQTYDGGFILDGQKEDTGSTNTDVYIIKTDNTGNLSWIKAYGGPGEDYASDIKQTSDSGFVLLGTYDVLGVSDVYLIRTNIFGDTVWIKTYGNASLERGYSIDQTNDSGYLITGAKLIKTDALGNTSCDQHFSNTTIYIPNVQVNNTPFIIYYYAGYNVSSITPLSGTGDSLYTLCYDCNIPVSVNISGDSISCEGDSLSLTTLIPNASYYWNTGDTLQSINPTTSGSYFVTVTDTTGCSGTSVPVSIIVNPLPSTSITNLIDSVCEHWNPIPLQGLPPGGTFSGNGVSSNMFYAVNAIQGWNHLTYAVTDSNGCTGSAMDSIYVDLCLGVESPNNSTIDIHLNSEASFLEIVYKDQINQVEIYNVVGERMFILRNTSHVDISNLRPGIYFVHAINEKRSHVFRFIK